VPPAPAHASALSSVQTNAPPPEPGVQHWIGGAVVLVVAVVMVVVLLELVVGAEVVDGGVIVVVVVVTGPAHVPSTSQASNLL